MWLDIPLAELDKPSLPKLLRLNIPEDVGDSFRKFGTVLLNDESGALMDAIENDCNGRAHRITLKVLQEWMLGKGERTTWTKETIAAAEEKHKMWLDIPLAELDKPSLPKLLRLNIPEDVGDNFRKFGTFLLNDESGALMDAIENDCNGRAHRITLKVLQEWMLGKGERTTWTVLVKTLNDCKLATLASKIQKEYL
jgi:hypothetical protein